MTVEDAAAHLAGEDEPTVRWLSGGRSTMDTVTAWIERNEEAWQRGGPVCCFGIREADGDRLVGMIEANLDLAGLRDGVANISYGLYPNVRGRGYASRAVELMCEYLASHRGVHTAVIQVHPENEASLRVPPRTGFRGVGMRVTSQNERLLTFVRRLSR